MARNFLLPREQFLNAQKFCNTTHIEQEQIK